MADLTLYLTSLFPSDEIQPDGSSIRSASLQALPAGVPTDANLTALGVAGTPYVVCNLKLASQNQISTFLPNSRFKVTISPIDEPTYQAAIAGTVTNTGTVSS